MDLKFNCFEIPLVWDSNGLVVNSLWDFNWFEVQVIWLSVGSQFKRFGRRLTQILTCNLSTFHSEEGQDERMMGDKIEGEILHCLVKCQLWPAVNAHVGCVFFWVSRLIHWQHAYARGFRKLARLQGLLTRWPFHDKCLRAWFRDTLATLTKQGSN